MTNDHPTAPLEELAQTIIRLSPRWSCLDLCVPYQFLKILEQSLKPDDLPLLRDFRADLNTMCPPGQEMESPEGVLQGFLAAPTLDSVAIILHFLQPARALALPPLTSLISLSVQGFLDQLMYSMHSALDILMQYRSLRHLTLTIEMADVRVDDDHSPIDLPELVDLNLLIVHHDTHDDRSLYESGPYHSFFDRLYTPSLKKLVLFIDGIFGPNDLWTNIPFLPLLSGHKCQLESLHINLPTSGEAIVECLRLVPRLTALTLTDSHPQVEALTSHLQLLIPTIASPIPLCPCLEDVHLNVMDPGLSDATLLTFAESRWRSTHPGISRLKKFHAVTNRPMITDIRPRVRVLLEEGMDLVITHIDPESDPADEGASPSRYFGIGAF